MQMSFPKTARHFDLNSRTTVLRPITESQKHEQHSTRVSKTDRRRGECAKPPIPSSQTGASRTARGVHVSRRPKYRHRTRRGHFNTAANFHQNSRRVQKTEDGPTQRRSSAKTGEFSVISPQFTKRCNTRDRQGMMKYDGQEEAGKRYQDKGLA
ncbi:hypothetical protein BDP67DRAFT_619616 [Colletotrichum lupini]|nr:hypothetical protein BDP67DRAFT_619616 [Colletotrichum lupini]